MFAVFKKPTLAEQIEAELDGAERALLTAEAEVERAQGNLQLYQARVVRLRDRLADAPLPSLNHRLYQEKA